MLASAGQIQWGDFATWVASIGTVAAVGVALFQVWRERQKRLEDEVRDRQKAQADRDERRHAHARLISAWTGPTEPSPDVNPDPAGEMRMRTPIYLNNSSSEPIHEVVVALVFVQGAAPHSIEEQLKFRKQQQADERGYPYNIVPLTTLSILPPGRWRVWIPGGHWSGVMAGRLGVDIAFLDRAELGWIRRSAGKLEELGTSPFEYFKEHGLYGPYDLSPPEALD